MVVTILESNDNVILFVENVGKFADFLFYFTLMFASDVVFGVFRKIAERTRFLDLFDGVASAFSLSVSSCFFAAVILIMIFAPRTQIGILSDTRQTKHIVLVCASPLSVTIK